MSEHTDGPQVIKMTNEDCWGSKAGAQTSGTLKGRFLIVSSLRYGSEYCRGGKFLSLDLHTQGWTFLS